jgi:nucleoside-diphosphate-sugar epimerase
VADTQKLFTQLSWKPKIDLDEGLNRTINWWKNSAGK